MRFLLLASRWYALLEKVPPRCPLILGEGWGWAEALSLRSEGATESVHSFVTFSYGRLPHSPVKRSV